MFAGDCPHHRCACAVVASVPTAGVYFADRGDRVSKISRRQFVKAVGGSAAIAALPSAVGCERRETEPHSAPTAPAPDVPPAGPISAWEERYRAKWAWDRTAKSTHFNNCAYQTHCLFEVYVKDGRIVREEQAANYPAVHAGVPDPNPRGCQKGCTYGALSYGAYRVTKPLKREGERGSGRWQEVSFHGIRRSVKSPTSSSTRSSRAARTRW
jgi:anaerobic selenocysteine-containing dehydrogenase